MNPTGPWSRDVPTVDIIMSVYNGIPWIEPLLRSIRAQSWREWRLWIRDDGSTDETWARIADVALEDERIHLHSRDGINLGACRSFGVLLEELPPEARYIALCDADDIWLPHKIERTMEVMLEAEARIQGGDSVPLLVHSDLRVVDEELRTLATSFWAYQDIRPEPVTLPRLIVQNVATGPTILMNAALRERVGTVPAGAVDQDWWIALVAAAFGRVIALDEPTVLYRQHGSNRAGAHAVGGGGSGRFLRRIPRAWTRIGRFRRSVAEAARQADAFLERYGEHLEPADREHLRAFAEIPECSFLERKRRLLELRVLPEHGWMRNLGVVLRG